MSVEDRLFRQALSLPVGTEIPKPEAKASFSVKGPGKRRGEEAIVYTIPSHTRANPYQKGINRSEFVAAARRLRVAGEFTREWFNEHLPACAKEGGCNFTTIGGLLELLGEAQYAERGVYRVV